MSSAGNTGLTTGENICDRIIDDITKARAKEIAVKVVDTMPAKCKKACIAGALYLACEEAGLPIGLKDICAMADSLSCKDIADTKAAIKEKLDNYFEPEPSSEPSLEPSPEPSLKPSNEYLERFCISLGLGINEIEAAKEAYANLDKIKHGHTNRLKAAAVVFLVQKIVTDKPIRATELHLFTEIGNVASLRPLTIKDFYRKKILPSLSEIVPPLLIHKINFGLSVIGGDFF